MYSEKTLRKKAYDAGYQIQKGFQHYHSGGVVTACGGERLTGYNIMDLATGIYVWGSYNQIADHQLTIEEVEEFLRDVYEDADLKF